MKNHYLRVPDKILVGYEIEPHIAKKVGKAERVGKNISIAEYTDKIIIGVNTDQDYAFWNIKETLYFGLHFTDEDTWVDYIAVISGETFVNPFSVSEVDSKKYDPCMLSFVFEGCDFLYRFQAGKDWTEINDKQSNEFRKIIINTCNRFNLNP